MRALHLNYHEITEDPRVLKECTALSARGVEVTVLCGLTPGKAKQEQVGPLDVHRIPWMSIEHLTPDYLKELSRFPLTESLARERLEKLLPAAQNFRNTRELLRSGVCDILDLKTDFPEKDYRAFRGPKRLIHKMIYKRKVKSLETELKAGKSDRKHQQKIEFFQKKLEEYPLIPPEGSTVNKMLKRAVANPKDTVVASNSQVYQASAFLFDLNSRGLKLQGPFDVVHAHDIYTLVAGVNIARAHGAKLIYDAHEYEPERASKMPPEGNSLAQAIELDCFRDVDAIVTVSSGICDLYSKRFTKRAPVLVMNAPEIVSPMPDDATLSELRLAFRERLGVASDALLISYTGWVLQEQRGLKQVAQALCMMPNAHLVILGPRDETRDAILRDIAENLGVSSRIHMLPPVPHADVVPTIRACDVSIVPFQDATLSYRYAMPNKLFEGVFAGLPVAVADLPDMKKFVETLGRGKAMDASDPDSIAETVSDLYEQREKYRMSTEAFDDLIAIHSWSAQADRLHALYRKLEAEIKEKAKTN